MKSEPVVARRVTSLRDQVWRALFVLLFCSVMAVAALPVTAGAAPKSTTSSFRTRLEQQINNRLGLLAKLTSSVNASDSLSSEQALVLEARLSSEVAVLDPLLSSVISTSNLAKLKTDEKAFNKEDAGFEVVSLQVHLVLPATEEAMQASATSTRFPSLESELWARKGTAGWQSADGEFKAAKSSVGLAERSLNGVASDLLALTAQGYPANLSRFNSLSDKITSANTDLTDAKSDLDLLETFIASNPPPSTTTTSTTTTTTTTITSTTAGA